MKTCKECAHWSRNEKEEWRPNAPPSGACNSKKFVYDEPLPSDGLEYWDHEGYSAGFKTGPDFGCIHWLAKA